MEDNRLYTVKDLIKDLEGFDPDAVIYPPKDSTADYLFEVDNSNTKLNNGLDDYWLIMTFEQEAERDRKRVQRCVDERNRETAQCKDESQLD